MVVLIITLELDSTAVLLVVAHDEVWPFRSPSPARRTPALINRSPRCGAS